eukprot:5040000-Pleurochrysis_carterae.AAC.1
MATNPVTRRLVFNTKHESATCWSNSAGGSGSWSGGSALLAPHHFRATNTSDQSHVGQPRAWVATLEENRGVDLI